MYIVDHRTAMRGVLEVVRTDGVWPVTQHVHLELARGGVGDPAQCVATAPPEFLEVDNPDDPGGRVRITVQGLCEIEPHAPELSLFIGVVRGCVDTYRFHILDSPSRAQSLKVEATDLVRSARHITRQRLTVIGLLLDVEGVAPIRFQPDRASPWSVDLGMHIWRFQDVAVLADYLARADGSTP